jgi:hypothetical protein
MSTTNEPTPKVGPCGSNIKKLGAGELDLKQATAPDRTSPFRKKLNEYGQKGRVIASVVGAFAEMPPDTYAIADHISSDLSLCLLLGVLVLTRASF